MKLYEVGGHVRDGLLGIESNDVDYAVEMNPDTILGKATSAEAMYQFMNHELNSQGFKIFLETPDCFTTRAMFPESHEHSGVADFVMCRKEIGYVKGTRKPIVEVGTILDDLRRRDFTINCIARDVETGEILDPFNGHHDLRSEILKCPVDAETSFNDDPLRILRAYRFCVTKRAVMRLAMDQEMIKAIKNFDATKFCVVSVERTMIELEKMFKHDTLIALNVLSTLKINNEALYKTIMAGFWLLPTNRKK